MSLYDMLYAHIPQALARRKITAADLRPMERFGPAETVLLVGSYARGEASDGSDLDIAVLCDQPPARDAGTHGFPSLAGEAVIVGSANGLMLNIDFIRRDIVRALAAVLDAIPGDPGTPSLGNLGTLEMRTIERVGSGILLQLVSSDRQLIDALDIDKARANKAALAFQLCMGHFSAATARYTDPLNRAIRLRESAQDLLIAEVNALGFLTLDTKYLGRRASEHTTGSARELMKLLRAPDSDVELVADAIRLAAREFLVRAATGRRRLLIRSMLQPNIAEFDAILAASAV